MYLLIVFVEKVAEIQILEVATQNPYHLNSLDMHVHLQVYVLVFITSGSYQSPINCVSFNTKLTIAQLIYILTQSWYDSTLLNFCIILFMQSSFKNFSTTEAMIGDSKKTVVLSPNGFRPLNVIVIFNMFFASLILTLCIKNCLQLSLSASNLRDRDVLSKVCCFTLLRK